MLCGVRLVNVIINVINNNLHSNPSFQFLFENNEPMLLFIYNSTPLYIYEDQDSLTNYCPHVQMTQVTSLPVKAGIVTTHFHSSFLHWSVCR